LTQIKRKPSDRFDMYQCDRLCLNQSVINTQIKTRDNMQNEARTNAEGLNRTLSLPLVVLYGIGVTVGAGIYVLIGVTAGKAGVYAPFAFLLAAAVVALSAGSFAEMAGRLPVSAGEAAYVQEGFRSKHLALGVGLLVITSAIVSSAAISIGAMGYILEFIDVPEGVIIALVVLAMGAIAATGNKESVTFAGLFTLIEVAGLLAIVAAGLIHDPTLVFMLQTVIPPLEIVRPGLLYMGQGCSHFSPLSGLKTWPMSLRRRRTHTVTCRALFSTHWSSPR